MTAPTITPTGEAYTIGQTRAELRAFDARAAAFIDTAEEMFAVAADVRKEAARLMAHANNLAAQLQHNEMDQGTLALIASLREQAARMLAQAAAVEREAQALTTEAEALRAAAVTALHGINSRHSGVEEASQAAPEGGALKDYYKD